MLDDAARLSERMARKGWKHTLGDAIEVRDLDHFTKGMAAVVVREIVSPDQFWDRRVQSAKATIESIVPPGAAFVLVDRNNFGDFSDGRHALPLVLRDGEDWGTPETSEIAVKELTARISEGATHFVLPWTCSWWAYTYPELFARLNSEGSDAYHDGLLAVFPLRK